MLSCPSLLHAQACMHHPLPLQPSLSLLLEDHVPGEDISGLNSVPSLGLGHLPRWNEWFLLRIGSRGSGLILGFLTLHASCPKNPRGSGGVHPRCFAASGVGWTTPAGQWSLLLLGSVTGRLKKETVSVTSPTTHPLFSFSPHPQL
ncbi:hypothetical protein HJG60_010937 [Phyllostomus discolor]|uniref:Uncharacterized protein n=1 Tax=Phyllostomus discolor TaxID=89673 RepID=A0A834A771_9CHIR|nr:hypothetical protein HJG60_010937 [Phyllostomus discolor]